MREGIIFLKYIKLIVSFLAISLLVGCTDYSYTKAKQVQNKAIVLSEPDSRMVLLQQINDALATRASIEPQIVVYLQDTVKPTTDMKSHLSDAIEVAKESINSIQIKTKEYRVVEKMKSAQENAIALMKENIEILTDMQKASDKNDFTDLTQAYTNYQNNLSKLQGIVVG